VEENIMYARNGRPIALIGMGLLASRRLAQVTPLAYRQKIFRR